MKLKPSRIAARWLAALAIAGSALAQKKYDPGATDTEIKIGNINPYSGPASAYGTIGKADRRLLQEGQRRGRHQRPQDQLHQPTTTATARRRRSRWCASWSSRTRCCSSSRPLGTPPNTRDPQVHERRRRCRSSSSPPARPSGATRRTSRGPWAGSPTTRPRARIYAAYILKNKPNAKIGDPLPERRLRQGLPQGLRGRARRQGQDDDRHGSRPTRSPTRRSTRRSCS